MPQHIAHRSKSIADIPSNLVGDWCDTKDENITIRLDFNGNYYWVIRDGYLISNGGQDFQFQNDHCIRTAGTTSLQGVWRMTFPGGEWLDYIFGRYQYYAYEWNDGVKGGGYYHADATHLCIVEQRARFICNGNAITIYNDSGMNEHGTFNVNESTLTLVLGTSTKVYSRKAMY